MFYLFIYFILCSRFFKISINFGSVFLAELRQKFRRAVRTLRPPYVLHFTTVWN